MLIDGVDRESEHALREIIPAEALGDRKRLGDDLCGAAEGRQQRVWPAARAQFAEKRRGLPAETAPVPR